MAGYVQLDGLRTWYEEHGDGEPLVLLHPGGAGIDSRAWQPNLGALAGHFRVYTPDRRGHGHTPDVEGPITYDAMALDTIAFIDTVVGRPAHVVGCSDGAIVALLVALRRSDLASRLVFVSGVFHHDGWAPGVIDACADPPAFLEKLYGDVSPDGPEHYPVIVDKLAQMHTREPTLAASDLANVKARMLVMVGDDDEVTLEHAVAMYRGLRDAELMVVPGTSHGLLVEKSKLCNSVILEFLTADPVETIAPIRRAGRPGS
jgi:pimeloyl-ACP methyl ester carboxylesterase